MPGRNRMFELIQGLGVSSSYICLRFHRRDCVVDRWRGPSGWADHYISNAFSFRDPAMMFAFSQEGVSQVDQTGFPDPCNVLEDASRFGLKHRMVASAGPVHIRSFCILSRPDRPYNDKEMSRVHKALTVLHYLHEKRGSKLTGLELEALGAIASGMNYDAASKSIGISFSAVKARLSKARRKMGAKNTLEAVHEASRTGAL